MASQHTFFSNSNETSLTQGLSKQNKTFNNFKKYKATLWPEKYTTSLAGPVQVVVPEPVLRGEDGSCRQVLASGSFILFEEITGYYL